MALLIRALELGPPRDVLLQELPLTALCRLRGTCRELQGLLETWVAARSCQVSAVDVTAGEHVRAILQLLCVHGAAVTAPHPGKAVCITLAAGTYRMSRPLQLRRRVHLVAATAGTVILQYRGEGCCLEVRTAGTRLCGLTTRGGSALRVHKGASVEVERCVLHGTVAVQRGGEATLRSTTIAPLVAATSGTLMEGNGGWDSHHAVSVEGSLLMEHCIVRRAGGRGVNASARAHPPATVTLTCCRVVDSRHHGVFADGRAYVRPTLGLESLGSIGGATVLTDCVLTYSCSWAQGQSSTIREAVARWRVGARRLWR
jgi:hypothetical protein